MSGVSMVYSPQQAIEISTNASTCNQSHRLIASNGLSRANVSSLMRKLIIAVSALACGAPFWATTLQQLTLDAMIQKSSVIVLGKAQPSYTAMRGTVIFTHYRIQVAEELKGVPAAQFDVAVPGGSFNGSTQNFSGSPAFADGQEHVFFLWTSRTGLTQVIGLSQGLFDVKTDNTGSLLVSRAASFSRMLDPAGHEVADGSFSMRLMDFKSRVSNVLAGKAAQ